jgi:glycine cleavage system aminomethyltransferase T
MYFSIKSPVLQDAFYLQRFGQDAFMPAVFTGPEDELLACRKTAWLGCQLNMSPVYDVFGPDAIEFLNSVCVNRDFGKMKDGSSRHAIICNEKGQMVSEGVILKNAESFRTYWLAPVIATLVERSKLNVRGAWIIDEYFFQIDGPKSLEIIEKASQTNIHDLKFAQNKSIRIAGHDVRIHRLGMSGALAYEFHGPSTDADEVYTAVREAGKEFGIRPLGCVHYCMNHTPGGYPNQHIHYSFPFFESGYDTPDYKQWVHNHLGSCQGDDGCYYVTPFDVSWDYLIDFNHDFIGKSALQKIASEPRNRCVTLEWNADDAGDVFASRSRGKDVIPYDHIDNLRDGAEPGHWTDLTVDKVLIDNSMIGRTSGRVYDYYYKKTLSLAFLKEKYAKEGTDVVVLWGRPGTPQKEIRATVARFPYYNEEYRNETFDVSTIPCKEK